MTLSQDAATARPPRTPALPQLNVVGEVARTARTDLTWTICHAGLMACREAEVLHLAKGMKLRSVSDVEDCHLQLNALRFPQTWQTFAMLVTVQTALLP